MATKIQHLRELVKLLINCFRLVENGSPGVGTSTHKSILGNGEDCRSDDAETHIINQGHHRNTNSRDLTTQNVRETSKLIVC